MDENGDGLCCIKCCCGSRFRYGTVSEIMGDKEGASCDQCSKGIYPGDIMLSCPKGQNRNIHMEMIYVFGALIK